MIQHPENLTDDVEVRGIKTQDLVRLWGKCGLSGHTEYADAFEYLTSSIVWLDDIQFRSGKSTSNWRIVFRHPAMRWTACFPQLRVSLKKSERGRGRIRSLTLKQMGLARFTGRCHPPTGWGVVVVVLLGVPGTRIM